MSAPEPAASGAIYDIGYQHYDGPRLGRRGATWALYVQGLRAVFGIGRGGRAKVAPIALIVFLVVPAVIQSAVMGLTGNMVQLFTHEGYFRTTVWVFALFCAFQTPELVSGDQQFRVLALYLSRAVTRSDYVVARVAALWSGLFIVALAPHIVLLLGAWFAAPDLGVAMQHSVALVGRIVVDAALIAALLASVSIALASLLVRQIGRAHV